MVARNKGMVAKRQASRGIHRKILHQELSVDAELVGDSFAKARGKAFINSCNVWNALDNPLRYRIKLPATAESCPYYNVAGELGGDPSAGSDSGSESNECNDE